MDYSLLSSRFWFWHRVGARAFNIFYLKFFFDPWMAISKVPRVVIANHMVVLGELI